MIRYPIAAILVILTLTGCKRSGGLYQVADRPWAESFGSQRAVLHIHADAEAVHIDLPWRRHDRDPEKRMLLLVSALTGDTVANIQRIRVDRERCEILAGPVQKGTYFFYYLPFQVQKNYGFYDRDYLPAEPGPDPAWEAVLRNGEHPKAGLIRIEARTGMDNFHPMEVIPMESEKKAFLESHPDTFLVFAEDRANPVRMWDEIPYKWIRDPRLNHFSGSAFRNEYYVFQLALYASKSEVKDLEVGFSSLLGPGNYALDSSKLTCFNTEGTDTYGRYFTKEVDVARGRVQALWIGVDIPDDAPSGVYRGSIRVGPAAGNKQMIQVRLNIKNKRLDDRGDSEAWRHSRLRWLNSRAGLDGEPVSPYTAIEESGELEFLLSGKTLRFGQNGMPASIRVDQHELLHGPIAFRIVGSDNAVELSPSTVHALDNQKGLLNLDWSQSSEQLELRGSCILESDGYLRYHLTLNPMQDIQLEDVRLEIPFRKDMAQYLMGMGLPGTALPEQHLSHWKGPEDSFWLGNTRGGLWVELRGSSYHGPLLNLYHPPPPESWNNTGIGGFRVDHLENQVTAMVFSGERKLKAGEKLEFEFALLITPVKPVNTLSQFRDRYYHNSLEPDPGPDDLEAGIRIVNLHHANRYNPFINYPFKALDELIPFVEGNQAKGLKVKIYYTIRELSNHVPEIWALRSLQDEIFAYGPGGGYPWLREHLGVAYRPQWYDHSDDSRVDASILTSQGESRWINYYIEGLAWLIRNVGIDGLYLDDVSFDRHIMKRIRKVMESEKAGCLIDLHSNTGFSRGPATQYAEYFPYVDKLWFGESFRYDEMSWENWLVEVSGIPFGLMGDMLHGGGNPWLGMVFGMTTRLPWTTEGVTCNPIAIWNIWDEFGIENARMKGFWDTDPLVETGHPKVKATAYIREDRVLISLGNFSDQTEEVKLRIDWEQLTFGPEQTRLRAPEIADFQKALGISPQEPIRVEPRRGWLLYLEAI